MAADGKPGIRTENNGPGIETGSRRVNVSMEGGGKEVTGGIQVEGRRGTTRTTAQRDRSEAKITRIVPQRTVTGMT